MNSRRQYRITYRVGQQIQNVQNDFIAIFESFSLLSWLSAEYRIRILSVRTSPEGVQYFVAKAYKNRYQQIQSLDLYVYVAQKTLGDFTYVHYIQQQQHPFQKINKVVTQFTRKAESMVIVISDEENLFKRLFDSHHKQKNPKQEKSDKRPENILQYRYIEPQDIRNRYERAVDHFHLAFQGGGAKGVAYIGGLKAIRDLYPNAKIRSIIGSSAGGMIALAVSAGASTEQLIQICKRMDQIPKDRTVQSSEELSPEILEYCQQVKVKFRQILYDYGIISMKMYDLLVEEILDDEIIEKLIDTLTGDNESLKTMFSLQKQVPVYSKGSFLHKKKQIGVTKKDMLVNYYGLLMGNLLNGEEVINICKTILSKLLLETFRERRDVFFKTIGVRPNYVMVIDQFEADRIALQLNMRQYYILTQGVEFTCTTVDLEDQVLRFLNHKTTPFVPVCKAVQMTSAFPVAFKALKWQPQWGKYYIHYRTMRRQIDLTGHQFTDGGVLANFPIKFLDNEEVRPFYFSHGKTEKTRIFGFGLNKLQDNENSELTKKKQKMASDQLKQLIKKKLPIAKLLWVQLFQTPRAGFIETQHMTEFHQIPLIEYVKKLIGTYLSASENFVKECFTRRMFQFKETLPIGKYLSGGMSAEIYCQQYEELRNQLQILYHDQLRFDYSYKTIYKCVKGDTGLGHHKIEHQKLAYVKDVIIKNLKDYALFKLSLDLQNPPTPIPPNRSLFLEELENFELKITELSNEAEKINKVRRFPEAETLTEDTPKINALVEKWYRAYDQAGNKSPQIKNMMQEHFKDFFQFTRADDAAVIENLMNDLTVFTGKIRNDATVSHLKVDGNDLTESVAKFSKNFTYKTLPSFEVVLEKLKRLEDNILLQKTLFEKRRGDLHMYVQNMVAHTNNPNLHLVFQSKGIMTKYYLDTYKLIKEFIFTSEVQKNSYLVQEITSKIIKANERYDPSQVFGLTDLVKFIIVRSDLHKYIEKYLRNIPDLIDLGYIKYEVNGELMATIQTMIEERDKNVLQIKHITCSSSHAFMFFMIAAGFDDNRILSESTRLRNLLQIDYQQIERDFYSLDWAMPMKVNIRKYQDLLWKNRFNMFESLEEYSKKNQLELNLAGIKERFEESKGYIIDGFDAVMDYVVSSQLAAENRPEGMSFEEFMAKQLSFKYGSKDYGEINKAIGKETKQALSILFSQYHSLIRHVFFMLNSEQNKLLALEKDLQKREAIWKGIIMSNFIKADHFKHHLIELIAELNLPQDIKLKEFYEACPVKIDLTFMVVDISSHVLKFVNRHTFPEMPLWAAVLSASSFPMLFQPLRSKATWCEQIDKNPEKRYLKRYFMSETTRQLPVMVSGNLLASLPLQYVTNGKIQELYYEQDQNLTFLSFGIKEMPSKKSNINQLFYRKFLTTQNVIKLFLTDFKLFETGLFDRSRTDLIHSFIEGQDKLTLSIYYKELISLPIRIDTLDFHRFKRPHVLANIVEETYYYTIEKFCQNNITFIQLRLKNNTITISFISKEHNTLDLMRQYTIQYRTNKQDLFKPVEAHTIALEAREKVLNLKFLYVVEHFLVDKKTKRIEIFERQFLWQFHHLELFEYYEALFGFQYGEVINGLLQPLKNPFLILNSQRVTGLAEVPLVVKCKSVLDIDKNGLYCELCCSPLVLRQIVTAAEKRSCTKCARVRREKYYCRNDFGPCEGVYCMRCSRKHAINKIGNSLWCSQGHEMNFANKIEYLLRSEQVKSSRCNLCQAFTDSYFLDSICPIVICEACSAEFM